MFVFGNLRREFLLPSVKCLILLNPTLIGLRTSYFGFVKFGSIWLSKESSGSLVPFSYKNGISVCVYRYDSLECLCTSDSIESVPFSVASRDEVHRESMDENIQRLDKFIINIEIGHDVDSYHCKTG